MQFNSNTALKFGTFFSAHPVYCVELAHIRLAERRLQFSLRERSSAVGAVQSPAGLPVGCARRLGSDGVGALTDTLPNHWRGGGGGGLSRPADRRFRAGEASCRITLEQEVESGARGLGRP